ncbi:MAG: hypothetical protein HY392_02725 [Candidatus Diapherotrites archaeon]|nr:hypothetical protein [Candidatus Diapherotrites archaeon]
MRSWLLFGFFLVLVFCLSVAGFVSKTGTISASETWIDGNTYLITGDVTVTGSGVTLTIEPGAVVKYKAGTSILIQTNARLVANGTADKNITFTTCTDQNAWAGEDTSAEAGCSGGPSPNFYGTAIRIASDANMTKSDSLSYLKVFDANMGIRLDLNLGSVHDSNFRYFNGYSNENRGGIGLYTDHTDVNVYNNTFTDFYERSSGVYFAGSTSFRGNIYSNIFQDWNQSSAGNEAGGIAAICKSTCRIYNNIFRRFDGSFAVAVFERSNFEGHLYSNVFDDMNNGAAAFYDAGGLGSTGRIYDNNFTVQTTPYALRFGADVNGLIYGNRFSDFRGPQYCTGMSMSGHSSASIYNNTFESFSGVECTGIAAGSSLFSGSIYNNRFDNFSSSGSALSLNANGYSGLFYNNLLTDFNGTTRGLYNISGPFSGKILNNTFSNFTGNEAVVLAGTTFSGYLQRNLFTNMSGAISMSDEGSASNNAYFNVTTIGSPAGKRSGDQNSDTGFTSDPFIAIGGDRNFVLNTTSSGGAKLVGAGGVDSNAVDVNNFFNLRTTQANNQLDRGTVDIGYHYDQNAPYVLVVGPNGGENVSGVYTIDFNVESGFSAASGITTDVNYSATTTGGTVIVSQALSSYTCSISANPYFVCSHSWDTTSVATGNYYILVRGTDSNGTMRDASDSTFSVVKVPDINVTRIEGTVDTGPMPVYSYIQDGNLTIDFNVMDTDSNGLLVDLNYSSTKTEGTGTVIVNDLNISKLNTTGAFNCLDTNFQNSTQCSIDWNVIGVGDGNYYLNISVSDGVSTDYNSSDLNVLVDNNGPSLTISSPSEGATITTSTVTLEYSATDTNTGIATYWVSSDGLTWINNSTSTSYNFTNQANGAHTYYVIATDGADNNSSTASVNVTVSVSTPGNQGGGGVIYCKSSYRGANICEPTDTCFGEWARAAIDTKFCCVGTCKPAEEPLPPEPPERKELFSLSKEYSVDLLSEGLPVLDRTGKDVVENRKRFASGEDVLVRRSVLANEVFGGAEGYNVVMALEVRNRSLNPIKGVEVVEEIDKSLVESASLLKPVEGTFEVLEEDPLVRFSMGDLEPGESKRIVYEFDMQSSPSQKMFEEFKPPLVLVLLSENDACLGVFCNDYDACTTDYCEKGECKSSPKAEGAVCGEKLECREGACVAMQTPSIPPVGSEPQKPVEAKDTGMSGLVLPLIALLSALVLGLAGYYVYIHRKKNRQSLE